MADNLVITSETRGTVTIVNVVGNLDALTAPKLSEVFNQHIASNTVKIVANLTQLDYSSSAGLRVLLNTARETRQRGGDLRLANVKPTVTKVFDMSGFTSIMKFFPTLDAAVQSYE